MRYLSGCTNDTDEPALIAAGIGLMVQPGNSYVRRIDRYPMAAADNGALNPETYIGDDRWLEWCDRLPRSVAFVVVPDVARRPDGSLGGDPVATWAKFQELAPVVKEMGHHVALAAQDGIELMPNLHEQIEACDVLFIAGSTDWKLAAWPIVRMARNMGKPVHMGRVNSLRRLQTARLMGCTSADGTQLRYLNRTRADGTRRGVAELLRQVEVLNQTPVLPGLFQFEVPNDRRFAS